MLATNARGALAQAATDTFNRQDFRSLAAVEAYVGLLRELEELLDA